MNTNPANYHQPQSPDGQTEYYQDEEHEEEEYLESKNRFLFFNVMPSWLVSFVAHMGIILVAALWFMPQIKEQIVALEVSDSESEQLEKVDVSFEDLELDTEVLETSEAAAEMSKAEVRDEFEPETIAMDPTVEFGLMSSVETSFESNMSELETLAQGTEVSGRSGNSRAKALLDYGGSAASEDAVDRGLRWLAKHQRADGGWSLNHTIGGKTFPFVKNAPNEQRDRNNPGESEECRLGATSLALLPFLGRGITHKEKHEYQDVVAAGLNYLKSNAKAQGRGISWHEPHGSMYSHGLVTMVFCEAYAMTDDYELAPYAQGGIWFIEDAQNPNGGGWRYDPREKGDTSVVGWQIMALKSAKMKGLDYNIRTIKRAEKFLDRMSIGQGAWYGYLEPPSRNKDGSYPRLRQGVSAVGLLCRMYMGWERDHEGLTDGVETLSANGPSIKGFDGNKETVDMYYNYYATQVLKHRGGSAWDKWNGVMRDFLIESQDQEGSKKGSWDWDAGFHSAKVGGRLYHTSLAVMTLEVYYRYLPLYQEEAGLDDFLLE